MSDFDADQFNAEIRDYLKELEQRHAATTPASVTIFGTVFHQLPPVDIYVQTEFPPLPDVPGVPPPPCDCWECSDDPPIAEVGEYV